MPIGIRILVFAVFFVTIAPVAFSCTCPDANLPPPCARFWRSTLVFTALVKDIDQHPDSFGRYPEDTLVRLSVQKIFKGTINAEIVDVQGQEIDCHRIYEKGQQYLIYADSYSKETNMIKTIPCFGRAEISRATEDLEYIRRLTNRQTESQIVGQVLKSRHEPLHQIKILAEGMGKSYEAVTDANGRYRVLLAKPGQYKITLVGPFTGATFSYVGNSSASRTKEGIQYSLNLMEGQCDYREIIVFSAAL